MERRFYKRTTVNITAEIISDGKSFEGTIDNVSEGGVGYLINSYIKDSTDFVPKKKVEIHFKTSDGNSINVECEIGWFSRMPAGEKDLFLGLRIMDPPSEYKEWIKGLSGSSVIKKMK